MQRQSSLRAETMLDDQSTCATGGAIVFANSRGELRLSLARQLGRDRRSDEAAAREGAYRHPSHHRVRVEPV